MKKTLIFLSLLTLSLQTATAQKPLGKQLYTQEKITWMNPWLNGNNASGMIFNRRFLNDSIRSFNDARLSAVYRAGTLKNIYTPETELTGDLNIRSYMKISDVYLSGTFGIKYDYGRNSRWRGLTDPYSTPFMLTDSIPGNLSNEIYHMSAGIAVPVGKFSVGGKITYQASILAKHKDLRNKNTFMQFSILPGFLYCGEHFRIGADAGYLRQTEKIEYKQVDLSTDKYLTELFGLWFYHSQSFSNSEKSRIIINSRAIGDLQLELAFKDFSIRNDFGFTCDYGEQTETLYNNLRFGDTETVTYSDDLTVTLGNRHRIRADITFTSMMGYRFTQRQELDPHSNIRVWITYGDPVNCYVRDYRTEGLGYTYRHAVNPLRIPWEISAGVRDIAISHTAKADPVSFHQELGQITSSLRFTYRWLIGQNGIELNPDFSWQQTYQGIRNEISDRSATEIMEEKTSWQLQEPLNEEYDFFSASKLGAGLRFRYSRTLNPEKSMNLFTEGKYSMKYATGQTAGGASRHTAVLSIGFTF